MEYERLPLENIDFSSPIVAETFTPSSRPRYGPKLAEYIAQASAQSEAQGSAPPLFYCGTTGSGRTHLLRVLGELEPGERLQIVDFDELAPDRPVLTRRLESISAETGAVRLSRFKEIYELDSEEPLGFPDRPVTQEMEAALESWNTASFDSVAEKARKQALAALQQSLLPSPSRVESELPLPQEVESAKLVHES